MALNIKQINALKPKEKDYKASDGGGLFLLVKPSGKKFWRLKFRFDGKEQTASFGEYPTVSLNEARLMRDKLKGQLAQGVYTPKRAVKCEVQQVLTFSVVAAKWFDVKQTGIADKTRRNIENRLNRHLLPAVGNKDIKAIRRADLIAIADELNDNGIYAEAVKVVQTAQQVFEFALLNDWIGHNPIHGINALLKKADTVHRAALRQDEVLPFFRAYLHAGSHDVTRIALLLLMLTGARSQAFRLSEWVNIDFGRKTWFMPANTMKMKNDFVIPLADWSIELLHELYALTGHTPFLFPKSKQGGGYKAVMSESTLNAFIRKLGFQATAHGFRSLMTDVCSENGFSRQVLQKALAHEERNKAFAAYQRTELLDERRKMAQFWADWLRQHYIQAQKQIAMQQLAEIEAVLNR